MTCFIPTPDIIKDVHRNGQCIIHTRDRQIELLSQMSIYHEVILFSSRHFISSSIRLSHYKYVEVPMR